jgi:RNase P protein component
MKRSDIQKIFEDKRRRENFLARYRYWKKRCEDLCIMLDGSESIGTMKKLVGRHAVVRN